MTFVNMERIEKRFNNQTVLRDVSLKMNRGEIVSIIGPSGSGKSTFCVAADHQINVMDTYRVSPRALPS